VNNLAGPGKRQAAGAPGAVHANKKDGMGAAASEGTFGNIVGRLVSAVRAGTGTRRGSGGAGANSQLSSSRAATSAAARAPAPVGGQPATQRRNVRRFAVQATLWCLAVAAITAGGVSYREFQRYPDEQQPPEEEAPVGLQGGAAVTDTAQIAGIRTAADAEIGELRAELSLVRQRLEIHEQKLRYIMDRYVEKSTAESSGRATEHSVGQAADERALVTHEASSQNATELAISGSVARAGDSPRKRKGGGGDTWASVDVPDIEGNSPVPQPGFSRAPTVIFQEAQQQLGAKGDIGAVAPEGRRAIRVGAEA